MFSIVIKFCNLLHKQSIRDVCCQINRYIHRIISGSIYNDIGSNAKQNPANWLILLIGPGKTD